MNLSERQLVKVAGSIRAELLQLRRNRQTEVRQKLSRLAEQMQELQTSHRKLGVCEARGWAAASTKVMNQIQRAFCDINYLVREVEQAAANSKTPVPALKEIYQELLQTDEEFDELRYDHREQMLCVSTEPIELEGVYLGSFEIQLLIPRVSEMHYPSVYRIVALEPHPAASNDAVTHPHVSDEGLCAGDAGAAIQMALTNGRICDCFMLVRSVLTTYNENSPYVALADWDGTPCYDCGYVMASDDVHWCPQCNCDFCSECTSSCARCDEWLCRGCLRECEVCGDCVCSSCMTDCPDCGRPLCETCLEENQCPCVEENEDEAETETRPDDKPASQVA